MVDVLHETLGKEGGVSAIHPDLIGEAYIVQAMKARRSDKLSAEAIQRCYAKFGDNVIESVVRCVMDFSSPDEKSPLVWMEGLIQANWDKPDGLEMLRQNVPMDSVALRDIKFQIAQRRLELEGDEPTPSRAGALNNVATALSKLGRREEALAAAQEAVSIRRTLAATRPDVFKHDLATSLNNVANRLGELGKREEAVAAAREAVAIYRELVAKHPDVFNPNLARSLIVLALRYEEIGHFTYACQFAHEAIATLQASFMQRPLVHQKLMVFILQTYDRQCQAAGIPADEGLINSLSSGLQQLETHG